ncbi:MAG: hypothetical protein ACRDLE_02990 [Gaiellaceae bacterium]
MGDRTLRWEQFEEAASASPGPELREEVSREVARTLARLGELLWVSGYIVGPDRAAGRSPFGDDATVGFATVVQVGGELVAGAITLLERENVYAAAALIRQVVEVEYLAWAFSEDRDEAATWLRSSREERLKFWQPSHVRERSAGRFRATDYHRHCESGGHPTPAASCLLPGHSKRTSSSLWWFDLSQHAASIWTYIERTLPDLDWPELIDSVGKMTNLTELLERWGRDDPLHMLVARTADRTNGATHLSH